MSADARPSHRLYLQVLLAIAIGVALGHFFPRAGEACKPLGDIFIRLIKMVIAPIVFVTVAVGIAAMGDLKKVGRVGGKAVLYFELLSTLALCIGLGVVLVARPGEGIHADVRTLDIKSVPGAENAGKQSHGFLQFLLDTIPNAVVDAFAKGDILQVLGVLRCCSGSRSPRWGTGASRSSSCSTRSGRRCSGSWAR